MSKKKLLVLLLFTVAIIGIIAPISATTDSVTNKNKDYTIESKEKTVKLKVTWNANGGKIGSKKTTITNIKKGFKIGKLATTPKRNGFTFKGWYTKKTGGTKITKNTKPTKSTIFYAQWNKKLNAEEKKLVGFWKGEKNVYYTKLDDNYLDVPDYSRPPYEYYFRTLELKADGTYTEITSLKNLENNPVKIYNHMSKGRWTASGGAINLVVIDKYEGKDVNRKTWNIIPPDGSERANFNVYGYQNIESMNYQLNSNGKTLSPVGYSSIWGFGVSILNKK